MDEHWRAGYADAERSLRHKEIFVRPTPEQGFRAFDFGGSEIADDERPSKEREMQS
jgi:hypothetical protein